MFDLNFKVEYSGYRVAEDKKIPGQFDNGFMTVVA